MATKTKFDVYAHINEIIMSHLEQGTAPWRRPWGHYGLAKNYVSGKQYRGINALLLNLAPVPIPYFLTIKQANELGGKVKKGTKSHIVTYYNKIYKDKNGKKISQEQARMLGPNNINATGFLKYYRVFATADIENIDFDYPEVKHKDNKTLQQCEEVYLGMKNRPRLVFEDARHAYYSPKKDVVNMPHSSQFDSSEHYYSTFFHELVHSTGHEKRLARVGITDAQKFGNTPYSIEELIAEIGASYLCGITNIERTDIQENNAAYIQGWLSVLKKDKHFIFKAASQAQKAVDYITNKTNAS